MITLYGGGPQFGLPEVSPYVTKTEVQLKMADLAYVKESAVPPASPKGQIPFISDQGELIADSTFIRAHIEAKYGVDLDSGLAPLARAQAWAVERMLENHFGWAMIWGRWMLEENFEKGPGRWFDEAPATIREQMRQHLRDAVRQNLLSVGIGRHTPEEIADLGAHSLAALSAILGGKPYLMGERPCGVDATCFSMLAHLLTPFFETPLRRRAFDFPNLPAYVDRLMAEYYPEHPWTPVSRARSIAA